MQPVVSDILLLWYLNLARVDLVDDIVWWLAIDRAANALCCAENLLGAVSKVLRERF